MSFFQRYLPFYRRNLKVAAPIMLAQLGGAIAQLVDTLMVARLGTISLAAVSFASSVFMVGFVAATGVLLGGTPIIGQLFAQGKNDRISQMLQNMFLVGAITTAFVMILLSGVCMFMPLMGQDADVVAVAQPYFITLVLSLFPFMLFASCRTFLEGLGNTSAAMVCIIISNIVNIVFNYLLIFGKFGFPEWGAFGAGVSTFISRAILPFLIYPFLRYRAQWWSYFLRFRRGLFSKEAIRELFSVGLPIALQILLEVTCFSISAVMVGWFGAEALAGNQIANNISNMVFMVILGISSATTIRISHQYGARDYLAMRMAANASIHLCLLINAVMGTLMVVFRYQIASWFSSEPAVVGIGAQLLIMTGIFQLSDGMQAVGAGILRGIKDVKICVLVAFISYILVNLPLGYLLAVTFNLGAVGIWTAFIFGLSVAAVLFRIRYLRQFRRIEAGEALL